MLRRTIGLAGALARGRAFAGLPDSLKIDKAESTLGRLENTYGDYVDKTLHLRPLVNNFGKLHIVVPRRFAKTTTMRLVADLNRPNAEELFAGTNLAKEKFFTKWKPHPFVVFDFTACTEAASLENLVRAQIADWAKIYAVDITVENISAQMSALLKGIRRNTGLPVVVLIDEYDIPVREGGRAISHTLDLFYGAIKSSEVIKQVIMFGTLNIYRRIGTSTNDTADLSDDSETLSLFGFTQSEVNGLFKNKDAQYFDKIAESVPEIPSDTTVDKKRELVMGKLQSYYNGYHLCKTCPPVYNPYSILQARKYAAIKPYFAASEIIPEMQDIVVKYPFLALDEGLVIVMDGSTAFIRGEPVDSDYSATIEKMWSIGLITMKEFTAGKYHLKLANTEVREALKTMAIKKWVTTSDNLKNFTKVLNAADARDFHQMAIQLKEALPKENSAFMENENHLKHHLREIFKKLGTTVAHDVPRKNGNIVDLRVETGGKVFIFELKYAKRSTVEQAVQQIKDKHYCWDDLHLRSANAVYGIGLACFSTKETEVQIVRAFLGSNKGVPEIEYDQVATTV